MCSSVAWKMTSATTSLLSNQNPYMKLKNWPNIFETKIQATTRQPPLPNRPFKRLTPIEVHDKKNKKWIFWLPQVIYPHPQMQNPTTCIAQHYYARGWLPGVSWLSRGRHGCQRALLSHAWAFHNPWKWTWKAQFPPNPSPSSSIPE